MPEKARRTWGQRVEIQGRMRMCSSGAVLELLGRALEVSSG